MENTENNNTEENELMENAALNMAESLEEEIARETLEPTVLHEEGVENDTRFRSAAWYNSKLKDEYINVIGAGGIGSWLILALVRAGFRNINVIDDDIVSGTNIGGQFYSELNIGQTKTDALYFNIYNLEGKAPISFVQKNSRINNENDFNSAIMNPIKKRIIFCCVDNMEARKTIFDSTTADDLVIDGRMSFDNYQIYTLDTQEKRDYYYENYLFSDEEAYEEPCTAKATTHMGLAIASKMAQIFFNWVTNYEVDTNLCAVPFRYFDKQTVMQVDIQNELASSEATLPF